MDPYATQALNEYNSEDNVIFRGGKDGKPFWNVCSSQFMFVPAFSFPEIPGCKEYIFTAVDSAGKTHSFTVKAQSFATNAAATPLTPIWKDLAVGLVELKVQAVHSKSGEVYLAGARTFYKMAPFPGREALPPRACSYSECALKAFRYVFNDPSIQYWLTHGKPKPDYGYNAYPCKTIGSVIRAMIAYAKMEPQHAEAALKIAKNAADYLISITYGEDSPLSGLPPTYSLEGLIKKIVDENASVADSLQHTVMMIYPASVGSVYLQLEKTTGDEKYLKAALRIAEYYKNNVLPNGSWYLVLNEKTGKSDSDNCCGSFGILEFLRGVYLRTGDSIYQQLERNYFSYIEKTRLETCNWEAQFEDSPLSSNYSNLTHMDADGMINYIANNLSDDQDMMSKAEELMRFVEDQFVVWGEFAPWNYFHKPNEQWYSPAGLEQYAWYLPIDASTGTITEAFLSMYSATGNPLYLEKACALGDSITRMQNPENGVIPTHWITKDCNKVLKFFWFNCHIGTAFRMRLLAKVTGEISEMEDEQSSSQ